MSDKCGNCDCSSASQCVKKENQYNLEIVETEKSYSESIVMNAGAAEHDSKCKCGSSCSCVNCTCGH
ncbi:metallothionein-like protein type 3 [Nicotiana tabacum]|uniref:Metallothionein-like protein type 3 n=2 Tax=Nicotiana TaxID=4085 RepID=A0A1S4D8I7_TOBAC|nr:PREDICTED: metallothionein-like protein type 3 [Nicotiana sylvestris]XP_016509519.1 PREDICTED: metallothionein-like protein type 3 [Nicotiana tabacum]